MTRYVHRDVDSAHFVPHVRRARRKLLLSRQQIHMNEELELFGKTTRKMSRLLVAVSFTGLSAPTSCLLIVRLVLLRRSDSTMKLLCVWSFVFVLVNAVPRSYRRTRRVDPDESKKRFVVHVKNEQGKQHVKNIASMSREVINDYVSVELDVDQLAHLSLDDNIISIDEDYPWTSLGFRDDPSDFEPFRSSNRQLEEVGWGITAVQADQLQMGQNPVTVCVIDVGVDVGHPDLRGENITGIDRISSDGSIMHWDTDPTGHGTIVSGILTASINNNLGVRGVGKIPLFVSRALNDNAGSAYQSDIMGAMRDCGLHGAKIISLSLGGPYMLRSMRDMISTLFDVGILLVSAAGNDGKRKATFPGAHRDVISVAGLKTEQERWEYSNSGPWIELAAPAYRINSTFLGDGYALFTGTSVATPFVSGVAALVWSHFPACQNSQIRYALAKTAQSLNGQGCDDSFGYGLVRARAAYDFLFSNPCELADWGRERVTGLCTTLNDLAPGSISVSIVKSAVRTDFSAQIHLIVLVLDFCNS